jgi:hypothetical protein
VVYHEYYFTLPQFFEDKLDYEMSQGEADRFFNSDAKFKIQKLGGEVKIFTDDELSELASAK